MMCTVPRRNGSDSRMKSDDCNAREVETFDIRSYTSHDTAKALTTSPKPFTELQHGTSVSKSKTPTEAYYEREKERLK